MSERDILAAEYALGVLEGEALLEARNLEQTDAGFRAEVADWQGRLAPLFDGFDPVDAPSDLWNRVLAAIRSDDPRAAVLDLRRRVRRWQVGAGAAAAIAASLALVVAFDAVRPPAPAPAPAGRPAAPAMLTASISAEDRSVILSATYQDGQLIVTPARMEQVAGRDYELWVIGADSTPRSLGVVDGSAPRRIAVPAALASDMRSAGTLAISVEPAGGSPTGAPTGPVVATGTLDTV